MFFNFNTNQIGEMTFQKLLMPTKMKHVKKFAIFNLGPAKLKYLDK